MTTDNKFRVAVIAGDGIGREVIPAGMAALEAVTRGTAVTVSFTELPWGCEYYLKHHRMMDEDGFERLAAFDAIYLGAIGAPGVERRKALEPVFVHHPVVLQVVLAPP